MRRCRIDRREAHFIIERARTSDGVRVISWSGGVARDTITVVRVRECHEYWQRVGQYPICKGTLRWDHPSPFSWTSLSLQTPHLPLFGITIFTFDNVTGMLGSLLLPWRERSRLAPDKALHTVGCRDLYLPVRYAPPVVPAFEIQPQAFRFATPDILHGVAASIASFRRPLAWLTFPEPLPHVIDIVAMYV
ncbi:hypothetical protein EDD15DRAFT_875360 [Pisolithus albus]|nr:hypothetical protein EDD15DRAFT_875360 [Pisolithus albus]